MKVTAKDRLFVPATDHSPERYVEPGEVVDLPKEKVAILVDIGAVDLHVEAAQTKSKAAASENEG